MLERRTWLCGAIFLLALAAETGLAEPPDTSLKAAADAWKRGPGELPPDVLPVRTGWPSALPDDAPKPGRWPVPTAEQPEIVYYSLTGRILSRRFHVDSQALLPEVVSRLLPTTGGATPCGGDLHCRRASGPRGTPLEFAFWLALLDRFSDGIAEREEVVTRRGIGLTAHKVHGGLRNAQRATKARAGADQRMATRELMTFRVNPRTVCASQVRQYVARTVTGANAADNAAREVRARSGVPDDWRLRASLGIEYDGNGLVTFDLVGRHVAGAPRYTMRALLTLDVDARVEGGQTSAIALKCTADVPIFARDVRRARVRAVMRDNGVPDVGVTLPLPPPRGPVP